MGHSRLSFVIRHYRVVLLNFITDANTAKVHIIVAQKR